MTNSLKQNLFWTLMIVATVTSFLSGQAVDSEWSLDEPIVTYFGGWAIPWEYGVYPQTDASAIQLAEGGWNLVWASSMAQLDVLQTHGLQGMWTGSLDDTYVKIVRNHSALNAYFVKDEPKATEFASLGEIVSRLRELDPNSLAYINLLPNTASRELWGTDTYQQYLDQYINTVNPSLLSYDHYHFKTDSDGAHYLENLAIVSNTAQRAGIPFINIVQTCGYSGMRVPNGNELRYLHNTSLAYGAVGISNFVYFGGGFTGGMAEGVDGPTTPLYDTAKTINPQFVAVAKELQSLNRIGTYLKGYSTTTKWSWSQFKFVTTYDGPPGTVTLPSDSPFSVSNVSDDNVYSDGDPVKGVLLGFFDTDGTALTDATVALVVNMNYSSGLETRVIGQDDLSVFDPETGVWIAQGHSWADVSLLPGGSVLVGLTSEVPEPNTVILLVLGGVGLIRRKKGNL